MMMIINLTPHEINIVGENPSTIPPSGSVAHVSQERHDVGAIVEGDSQFPLYESVFGEVTGLPEPQDDTIYIVSQKVAAACPSRRDLIFPDDLVWDDAGKIIGSRGFGRIPAFSVGLRR